MTTSQKAAIFSAWAFVMVQSSFISSPNLRFVFSDWGFERISRPTSEVNLKGICGFFTLRSTSRLRSPGFAQICGLSIKLQPSKPSYFFSITIRGDHPLNNRSLNDDFTHFDRMLSSVNAFIEAHPVRTK
jgi:hypothetical protein